MHRRRSLPLVPIAALVALLAVAAVSVPAAATDRVVVVRAGDTLSEIAVHYGVSVARLQALNGIADPNRIYPGQRLRLSDPPARAQPTAVAQQPVVHVVLHGENLTGIAQRYGTSIAAIVSANGMTDPSYLRVGQRLTIPGTTTVPANPVSANPASGNEGATLHASMADKVAARSGIRAIITAEARAQGVPVAFALAVAWQESGWQARVVSSAGAVGVMQLTPPTADWVAASMLHEQVNLLDPRSNVRAGIRLLRHYLFRYQGSKPLALAAYYQGQTAADQYGVYAMTRSYVASVLALESIFAH